jgi:AraC-like DNA-binding protein
MKFYDLLNIGGVFTSLITAIVLFTRGKSHTHANRLLGTIIFAWGWYVLIHLLIVTGWIRQVPHLYRIGSPLYYLIPPFAFIYVRSLLYDETKLRKWDWLHFLPAILNVIDLIPFYLADTATKKQVVDAIYLNYNLAYQKGSGILPAFWHFQLRWMQGIIYLVIQSILIFKMLRKNKGEDYKNFKTVMNWLITFSCFCAFIYVGLGIMSIIAWVKLGTNVNLISSARTVPTYLQLIGFICLSVYLLFKPEILYGIPIHHPSLQVPLGQNQNSLASPVVDIEPSTVKEEEKWAKIAPFSNELILQYVLKLNNYMEVQQPFKIQGLTINELSKQLNMPLHHLSYLINNHYHKRFTDFINDYRVNFIKERFQDPNWKDYTFEGLATEAGFISRSNFFTAFKKATGLSPSEYLKNNQKT